MAAEKRKRHIKHILKKKKNHIITTLIVFGLIFFFSLSFDLNHTGYLAFQSLNQESFDQGAYSNTEYDEASNGVVLSAGQTTGTYTSDVLDAGRSSQWNSFFWYQDNEYLDQDLPDNGELESGAGGVDMTGNVLLLHLDDAGDPSGDDDHGEDDQGEDDQGEDEGGADITSQVQDSSGNNNNATAHWNLTFQAPGRFGTGVSFDGSNDYIDCGDSDLLMPSTFSVAAWININQLPGSGEWHGIVSKGDYDSGDGYELYLRSSNTGTEPNKICWALDSTRSFSSSVPSTGEWIHVVGTYDGASLRLYVNSVLNDEATASLTPNSFPLYVGRRYSNDASLFNGVIDEVALYNRALSVEEILNIYKRGVLGFNMQVRSCDDPECDEEEWSDVTSSPASLSLDDNQYFQYMATFSTDDSSTSPALYNTTIGYSRLNNEPSATQNSPADSSQLSVNYALLNTNVSDPDEDSLTVYFYGNGLLIHTESNVSSGSTPTYNWTDLTEGEHTWNVTVSDGIANSTTGTRAFTVSLATPNNEPEVMLSSPADNSNVDRDYVLLSATLSDADEDVLTAFFYGDDLAIHTENNVSSGSNATYNWTSLADGDHTWSVIVSDGQANTSTTMWSFVVNLTTANETTNETTQDINDTTPPLIEYTVGTPANNVSLNQTYIFVNVSASDENAANITFELYNFTQVINTTTFDPTIFDVNWTGLGIDVLYFYNVTMFDTAGNYNTTQQRNVTLNSSVSATAQASTPSTTAVVTTTSASSSRSRVEESGGGGYKVEITCPQTISVGSDLVCKVELQNEGEEDTEGICDTWIDTDGDGEKGPGETQVSFSKKTPVEFVTAEDVQLNIPSSHKRGVYVVETECEHIASGVRVRSSDTIVLEALVEALPQTPEAKEETSLLAEQLEEKLKTLEELISQLVSSDGRKGTALTQIKEKITRAKSLIAQDKVTEADALLMSAAQDYVALEEKLSQELIEPVQQQPEATDVLPDVQETPAFLSPVILGGAVLALAALAVLVFTRKKQH